ncbi:MAG: exodeoxyribonuclease VII small subunit [Clostridiales bacterium]|nr:exodeoxyribonuclease VII small subunit [Clostridiales bacterium]
MKFEESLKELEEIVAKMEQGNLTIDESIAAFTKGIELCKNCSKALEDAKGKITILQKEMESIKEVPFEVSND